MRALTGLVMFTMMACGGGRRAEPPPSPPSNASPVDCASAAITITRVLAGDGPQNEASAVQTAVAKRCTDDRWTDEARSCLSAAKSSEAVADCGHNHLTQAQADQLDRATAPLSNAGRKEAMAAMEKFRDQMCACTDAACAQSIADGMTAWSQEMSRMENPPQMTEDDTRRAREIGERLGECMQKAMAASQPPTPKLKVTGLSPDNGAPRGGTKVTFAGSGFTSESRTAKVFFGDKPAKNVKITSDAELVADAPAGKANQTVDVLVVFEPGGELKIVGAYTYGKKK